MVSMRWDEETQHPALGAMSECLRPKFIRASWLPGDEQFRLEC